MTFPCADCGTESTARIEDGFIWLNGTGKVFCDKFPYDAATRRNYLLGHQ